MSDGERGASDGAWAEQPLEKTDELLLADLAKLYTTLDPVPAGLVEDIITVIALDSLDAEIAELQSQLLEPAGARGTQASQVQSLTFSSSSLTLLIKVTPSSPDHVRIDGWAAPGAGAVVELVQDRIVNRTVADQDGQFAFDDVAHASTRFVVHPVDPGQIRIIKTPEVRI